MNLLGLFPAIYGTTPGGVQLSGRLAWDALKAQRVRCGGQVFLYGYDPAGVNGDERNTDRYDVIVHSKRQAIWRAAQIRVRPDLVFIWHLGLLRLVPLLRAARARVILMLLGVEAWALHDLLTRLLLPRVDLFLSISDYTWARFAARYSSFASRPHQTVHLGLDMPLAVPSSPAGAPIALMISRLDAGEGYKGHHEVITAWCEVTQRVRGAELWIVGEGSLRGQLEMLARSGGTPGAIRFFGCVDESKKQELLSQARCLLMPSRGEGFGLVYLEAMRVGRPCLVSDCDAGREVVNPPEAGLAVNPDDPQALADAVCRLLTPGEEWERWSIQARRRYEQNFTAAHFQQRLIAAIEPYLG